MRSAYIHIPFCSKICYYCDFCKFYYNTEWVDNYLNALEKEINKNYKNDEIYTLYIGGGTPSCLTIKELQKLFNVIDNLNLSNIKEYTIECNIEDINEEKLKLFKDSKINSISIGVQ